jgi:triosephosphate isomerase
MEKPRNFFIGANWKSHFTQSQVDIYINQTINTIKINPNQIEVLIAPSLLHLTQVKNLLRPEIYISSQNCSSESSGPYTGEVSASQLKDFGIDWVIIGHLERRNLFDENDEVVRKKACQALENGLNVVLCIGENLFERELGLALDVVTKQLNAIKGVVNNGHRLVVVYDPIWENECGKSLISEQVQEIHGYVRQWLTENIDKNFAKGVKIVYGGKVDDKNAKILLELEDVDGFFIEDDSLGETFKYVCEIAQK